MKDGDVALLENVRFYPEEEKNDPAFAKKLVIFSKEDCIFIFVSKFALGFSE
jgi:3-phosphoglycerate kinase